MTTNAATMEYFSIVQIVAFGIIRIGGISLQFMTVSALLKFGSVCDILDRMMTTDTRDAACGFVGITWIGIYECFMTLVIKNNKSAFSLNIHPDRDSFISTLEWFDLVGSSAANCNES